MSFWARVIIWIGWFALLIWWLSPTVWAVVEQVDNHNTEIKRILSE